MEKNSKSPQAIKKMIAQLKNQSRNTVAATISSSNTPLATRLANDNQNEQYQNNRHSELTRAEQEQVRRGYAPLFAAGYYADILNDMTTNVAKRTINTELRYTCIHT